MLLVDEHKSAASLVPSKGKKNKLNKIKCYVTFKAQNADVAEMQRILVPSTLADPRPVIICPDNSSSRKYLDSEEFLSPDQSEMSNNSQHHAGDIQCVKSMCSQHGNKVHKDTDRRLIVEDKWLSWDVTTTIKPL